MCISRHIEPGLKVILMWLALQLAVPVLAGLSQGHDVRRTDAPDRVNWGRDGRCTPLVVSVLGGRRCTPPASPVKGRARGYTHCVRGPRAASPCQAQELATACSPGGCERALRHDSWLQQRQWLGPRAGSVAYAAVSLCCVYGLA